MKSYEIAAPAAGRLAMTIRQWVSLRTGSRSRDAQYAIRYTQNFLFFFLRNTQYDIRNTIND